MFANYLTGKKTIDDTIVRTRRSVFRRWWKFPVG
jgi:hypothetical protein